MKHLRLFVFCLGMFSFWMSLQAQDTTSLRYAAFSDGGELILFQNDSTNLFYAPLNPDASFNALFHHPSTGELYCLFDSVIGAGRRDFYQIDPFSGAMTFVFSPTATYLAGACVGPNGIVYAISGNGGGGAGNIYAIDIFNGVESLFASTDMTFGGNFQVGANISYYPPTNELWIFGGSADSLIKINVNTQVETRVAAFLNADEALKATYLDGNTFWLCSEFSYTFDAIAADSIQASTFGIPDYITDLEKLDLISDGDTIAICGADSAMLRSRFLFDDYRWYHNGNLLPSQNRTIYVTNPGTYQLLTQYDSNGGFYMWSETVEVVVSNAPTAGFGVASSGLVGVPVNFSDSSLFAQDYFWDFGDGNFSSAANPSHAYLASGVYTVMLVVQNGLCRDTAYATVEILSVGMDEVDPHQFAIVVSPNPNSGSAVAILRVSNQADFKLSLLDCYGKLISIWDLGTVEVGEHQFDIGSGLGLSAGLYFLKLDSQDESITAKMIVTK
jgi:hypothetical protein